MSKLPSQCKPIHDWKIHEDVFKNDWPWVQDFLETNSALEAKTLFETLQREYPGKYQDGQLRTFQRRVKQWRALHGPANEVFFPQTKNTNQITEKLLTAKAVGETLSLSKRQVFRLSSCGKIPKPIRVGGSVRWAYSTIQSWIDKLLLDRYNVPGLSGIFSRRILNKSDRRLDS